MLSKRGGDEIAGELAARGYYRMLGHLTEAEMSQLTEMVLARCEWFPSVAECNKIMGEQNYSNPFWVRRRQGELTAHGYPVLPSPKQELLS